MDESWRKKFRRVLLVHDVPEEHEWKPLIAEFANDVTEVRINYFALDYLELPADCMIVDGRANDLTGLGMAVATAEQRVLRSLVLIDQRTGPYDVAQFSPYLTTCDHYHARTAAAKIRAFLEAAPPYDYQHLLDTQPWVMKPFTCTQNHIAHARALGYTHPGDL